MTPERWKRIEELYHAAEAVPAADRAAFLAGASSDEALRREVELLLNEPDGGFLARPALLSGLSQIAFHQESAAMVGRTIGSYHFDALLGIGGMGEVYRARDEKLGRDVAIKVLPAAFTNDVDRLARFEREARMLGALSHHGICGIHGLDDADGIRLLILELVEGETLADRIAAASRAGRSGLPLADALPIARQIAEALEVAHEKGIVHRDLKPANVKITPDGTVKILDFGLAKPVGGDGPPDLTRAPSVDSDVGRGGAVVGTAAYMSPEQARGLPVDRRTDIWAFGCVLYELLTGRGAFAGDTVSDSIARILEREPDWSILPASTPPAVQRLLQRCLEKNPRQRLRDIGEARIAIDTLDQTVAADVARGSSAAPHLPRWLPWAVAGVLAVAAVLLYAANRSPAIEPGVSRFLHVLPAGEILNGSRGGHVLAVSPDGSLLVYSGYPHGLMLRRMSDLHEEVIPGTEDYEAAEPVFSPDGHSIVFFTIADLMLKKIAVTGGAAQALCRVASPSGIRWGAEGIVFGQGSAGIKIVSADGGTPRQLVEVKDDEAAHEPQILPDGEHILFTLATGAAPSRWDRALIVVESLKTHQRTVIIDGGSDARYFPTGHLVYALNGNLYGVPFDPRGLKLTGERMPLVEGVRRASGSFTGAAAFSVADNGMLAYVPGPPAGEGSAPLDMGLMDRSGDVQPLHLQPGPYALPRVSPDGTRLAFQADDGKEAIVYTYPLSGDSAMQRLTSVGSNRFPVWAGNDRVAFQSDRDGSRAIWWQTLDGVAQRLTTPEPGTSHAPESWFGDTLLFSVTKGTEVSLWTYSVRDRTTSRVDAVASATPMSAAFSPDGRWIAYSSGQRNQMTLYVQGFPTGARHSLTAKPTDTMKHPRWSWDGRELCYDPNVNGFECVRVTAEPFAFGNPVSLPKKLSFSPPGTRANYDITRDGRFVGPITAGRREYVRGSTNQIEVVLNWFEELRARVPRR